GTPEALDGRALQVVIVNDEADAVAEETLCAFLVSAAGSRHSSEAPIARPPRPSTGMDGMKRSTDRILTTHAGSLPRPPDLRAMIKARGDGEHIDEKAFAERVRSAVAECVAAQSKSGIDIVSDGELGKPNFVMYVAQRLAGMEGWDY